MNEFRAHFTYIGFRIFKTHDFIMDSRLATYKT